MHVVAEHGARVAVVQRNGRAGERNEGGTGQRVAQVLGVAVAHAAAAGRQRRRGRAALGGKQNRGVVGGRPALFPGQPGLEAVLAAVRLVANDHDVAPVGEHREHVLVLAGREFLDGGEDDAARRPVRQQLSKRGAGVSLHRRLAQHFGGAGEDAEELVVQVVAVGHHHQRGVAHVRVRHQRAGEAGHLDALASALRMPDHPTLAGAAGGGRREHALHHRPHRVELVVARHFLDELAVVLEQNEVAQIFQQQVALEQAQYQGFEFAHRPQRVGDDAVDGAPGHEAFAVAGQRAHARLDAVGNHLQGVGVEQVGNVLPVGLQLVPGRPDVRIFVTGVFQLDHHQRQAVDEQHHVRAACEFRALHRELVHRQPVVGRNVGEIQQPHPVAARLAVALILHRHAVDQPAVQLPVGADQRRHVGAEHTAQRVVTGAGRDVRVQAGDGVRQPVAQHDIPIGVALAAGRFRVRRGDVGAVGDRPAEAGQPFEHGLFDVVFGNGEAHCSRPSSVPGSASEAGMSRAPWSTRTM